MGRSPPSLVYAPHSRRDFGHSYLFMVFPILTTPHVGSDGCPSARLSHHYFKPRPRVGSDLNACSLMRAFFYFNPRPCACVGATLCFRFRRTDNRISTRAPRVEDDRTGIFQHFGFVISIHALLAEDGLFPLHAVIGLLVSIHILHAGDDKRHCSSAAY